MCRRAATSAALLLAAAAAGAEAAAPNFVWILADDLNNDFDQDRISLMPNLRRISSVGAHFVNHAAAQPVCGPSRSSLLQGRFPHNTGYLCNIDGPSEAAYLEVANNTIGTWMTAAGYHTAFIGKYINGLEAVVPSGWNSWQAFSSSAGTYNYFNSTPYNCSFARDGTTPTSPCAWTAMTGVHQSDFVGQRGVEQMQVAAAAGLPFFVHLTPLMVHEGSCYGPHKDPMKYARNDTYWERESRAGTRARPARSGGCVCLPPRLLSVFPHAPTVSASAFSVLHRPPRKPH
jgi:arylsulfatase A-like enzyme